MGRVEIDGVVYPDAFNGPARQVDARIKESFVEIGGVLVSKACIFGTLPWMAKAQIDHLATVFGVGREKPDLHRRFYGDPVRQLAQLLGYKQGNPAWNRQVECIALECIVAPAEGALAFDQTKVSDLLSDCEKQLMSEVHAETLPYKDFYGYPLPQA